MSAPLTSASATSQALYATITGSLGTGTVMFASGWLYEELGAAGYFVMALLSLAAMLPIYLLARDGSRTAP